MHQGQEQQPKPQPKRIRTTEELLEALSRDSFRAKFSVTGKDLEYLHTKGLDTVMQHGRDFLLKRLAPATIPNDGKQTPWRGHPIFIAQHATATCCRGCVRKWHDIEKGRELTDDELARLLAVIQAWLSKFA
jgi:hypothetical protein